MSAVTRIFSGARNVAARWTGARPGRFGPRWQPRTAGGADTSPASGLAYGSALVLTLVLGLAAIALTAVGLGTLVDNVTDGDGIAVLDHPVARFVTAHRAPALTSAMRVVSTAGSPVGMTTCALIFGILLSVAWRSWTPVMALAATAAGAIGFTIVFKAALGRPRPPLIHAVVGADGYGFPSAHAAVAAAVCGVAAWICSARVRSWRARAVMWATAAMLAVLVGISRVYLGVHWTTDVIGGWTFGTLWLAVVVTAWAGIARRSNWPGSGPTSRGSSGRWPGPTGTFGTSRRCPGEPPSD